MAHISLRGNNDASIDRADCVRNCARWATESLTASSSLNKCLLSVSYGSDTLLDAGDEGRNETKPLHSGVEVFLEMGSKHANMSGVWCSDI